MVLFITLFYYLLPYIGFPFSDLFPAQNIRNNTREAPSGILDASIEPNNDLKVKPIVESDIGFLLEIDRYSCE